MSVQRGGFALGFIVGLLVGLALALGVALYVTKVPVPFVNKVPMRTPEQDAAEAERNKNWDPNAPLAGKPAPRPPASAPAVGPTVAPPAPPAAATKAAPAPPPSAQRDPAAILSGQSPESAKSTKPGADAFTYFVQVGAFAKPDDAEQQRARVALLGMSAKISEREQSGRTMYRVRLGPFERKEQADVAQEKLSANGIEAALVRVER